MIKGDNMTFEELVKLPRLGEGGLLGHWIEANENNDTKIIVSYYNKIWEPILKVAELLKLKTSQPIQNWLSKNDLQIVFSFTNCTWIA